MSTEPQDNPIPDADKERYDLIGSLIVDSRSGHEDGAGLTLALVSTAIGGEQATALAAVAPDGEGYVIYPLAVIVNGAVADMLAPPTGATESRS